MTPHKSDPLIAREFMTADHAIRRTMETGTRPIDSLLEGGLEFGLVHLFYGDRVMYDDLLRLAVHAQLPCEKGGIESSSIIIDSANMIQIDKITNYALEDGLEPEETMDHIFITRAFNSSQVYDIVMQQLEQLFEQVSARLLLVTGLPDLFIAEGATGDMLQQISHMVSKIRAFTMYREIASVITTHASEQDQRLPAGGRALSTNTQVHIHVREYRDRVRYTLAKHPAYPVRHTTRSLGTGFATTPPLSYFLRGMDGKE
ncbi:MAG: hypothetical protein K9W43_03645 [Candidatus Thorarchaeota archaeon]|nr:hypothetical protein [Candidatus Thorarchaeota archaeon]